MPGQGLEHAPNTAFENALTGLMTALEHVLDTFATQAASILQMIIDIIMGLLGG